MRPVVQTNGAFGYQFKRLNYCSIIFKLKVISAVRMKKSRNRKLYIGLIWLELNKAPFDDLIALY